MGTCSSWVPHLEYPLHEHAAEESYHVLAGTPAFGTEDGTWTDSVPDDAVHNPPWHRHAQRFRAEPTVLLYCWTGGGRGRRRACRALIVTVEKSRR
ncbi:MAG: hypothetical protein CL433_09465 [Acidimicrobiaceae bacterium]|jgi:hypothetical protein|nr:hypothetical protein [Acidimicrobiaceae bacterium]HAB58499.1 hypothetical protein [Acidimicrobiaceae bacterium]